MSWFKSAATSSMGKHEGIYRLSFTHLPTCFDCIIWCIVIISFCTNKRQPVRKITKSLKHSFTRIRVIHANFCSVECFLLKCTQGMISLSETNLNHSIFNSEFTILFRNYSWLHMDLDFISGKIIKWQWNIRIISYIFHYHYTLLAISFLPLSSHSSQDIAC